jgi:hypothetical protein
MLIAMVFAVLALALLFPETRVGGALRRLLVDEPARRLNRLKRGHVILLLLILALLAAAYVIGRQEGVAMIGQASADTLISTLGVDLATWIDMTAIGLAVAAIARFREAIGLAAVQARQWAGRCAGALKAALVSLARGRARRPRATPRPRHGEDPDRPAPGLAWA